MFLFLGLGFPSSAPFGLLLVKYRSSKIVIPVNPTVHKRPNNESNSKRISKSKNKTF